MKRLGICAGIAGVVVGQTFNGPATEAFGLYLIGLAVLLAATFVFLPRSSSTPAPTVNFDGCRELTGPEYEYRVDLLEGDE